MIVARENWRSQARHDFIVIDSAAGGAPLAANVFALPIDFHGYYPGYAAESAAKHDRLTFVVLKGKRAHQRHDHCRTLSS